jgi:hypothetical protein
VRFREEIQSGAEIRGRREKKKKKEKRDFIAQKARNGAEVSLRGPTHSQERMRKKKSAHSVRNDSWGVAPSMNDVRGKDRNEGAEGVE